MTTRNQIALTGIAFSSLLAGSILAACGGGAPGATSTPQAAVTGGGFFPSGLNGNVRTSAASG